MAPDETPRAAEAIRDRLRQYELTGDPTLVTGGQARREAAELLAGSPGVEEYLLAGRLAWYRHLAFGERRNVRELVDALRLLAPVYASAPDRLPPPLRVVYEAAQPDTPLLDASRLAAAAIELLNAEEPDTVLAIALQRLAIAHCEDNRLRPELLDGLGAALVRRFTERQDADLLRESVTVRRHAVALAKSGDPAVPSMLSSLANALYRLFVVLGESAHLSEAVAAAQRAVELSPAEDAGLPDRYSDLSEMLFAKFMTTADVTGQLIPEDALEAAGAASSALSRGGEAHPRRDLHQALYDQAWEALQLIAMANHQGDEPIEMMNVNLRKTQIALLRAELESAAEADPPIRAGLLRSLAEVHLDRFEAVASRLDLDDGIRAARAAVDTSPPTHPDHFRILRILARALLASYRVSGDLDALRTAVDTYQQVANLTPPDCEDRADILSETASLLLTQCRPGETDALDNAISTARAAVMAAEPDSGAHGRALAGLGTALELRYRSGEGTQADLDEGIEMQLLGLNQLPEDHPDWSPALANVASGLLLRYGLLRQDSDLDEAVARARDAMDAVRSRPDQWMRIAEPSDVLADALVIRYRSRGDLSDLDEAITVLKVAVEAAPLGLQVVTRYCEDLAMYFLLRYERSDAEEDLDQASEFSLRAVESAPDNVDALTARAFALFTRAKDDEALTDEAIAVAWQALERTPQGSATSPALLRSLAYMLTTKAYRILASSTLGSSARPRRLRDWPREWKKRYSVGLLAMEAQELLEEAVRSDPDDYPICAAELGDVLVLLHRTLRRSRRVQDKAASYYRTTALSESTPPDLRLSAARRWGLALAATQDWDGATDAYALAIDLLPQLAPRSLRHADREHGLSNVSGLAADAAACAVRAGRPVDAVRLFEAGRGVLWAQELEERDESTRLREQVPDLANRFERLRELIGHSGTDMAPGPAMTDSFGWRAVSDPPTPGAAAAARQRLTDDWRTLLAEIRALPGFTDFLSAPELEGMPLHPGVVGPVALLSASAHGGCALLLHPDGRVDPLPLPLLTDRSTTKKASEFLLALEVLHQHDVSLRDQKTAQDTIRATLTWLWTVVVAPVLDRLGFTRAAPTRLLPRIWCSPSGPLSCFPLHAAMSDSGERALDRAVFSYTSTARALRRAQALPQLPDNDARVLVVAMPETQGELPLPAALDEARSLVRTFNATELIGSAATHDAVRSALPSYGIVHFACHGRYDPAHPAESRLLLYDHQTHPFTVREVSQLHLPRARLAYLSACSTASFSGVLVDEAIHLSAAFQSAGFPQVIGTLWPVADAIAAEVCEAVYTGLRTGHGGGLEIGQAARALHGAIRELSDRYPATPSLWAAYLHVGP
ncbi:CHAT domain-containing protein [Streptomyces sp. NBC_00554]|uniref:CHAT domain-containing tetratricopeptide repeat protein n=1 Tax=Streptomyces sp. NBC_00554 TaxID=2903661 RepID=UPI00352DE802|nr:CHAT domain-containing protein [Streptomyces sp. NBC_00554]